MTLSRKRASRWLAWTAGVLATCASPCWADSCGCNNTTGGAPVKKSGGRNWFKRIDNCATIPKGAIPQPYGWFVHGWQNAQCAKAEADDFVVYKHEWFKGGSELGPYGIYHMQQMLKRLPSVPFPVLLQVESQDPQRNEMRRAVVVNLLAQSGIADSETRVVLGYPEAEGLYGDEAPRIYRQMITRQNPFNMFGGGFGGGGGGFGGLNSVPGGGTYGGFGGPPVAVPQNLP